MFVLQSLYSFTMAEMSDKHLGEFYKIYKIFYTGTALSPGDTHANFAYSVL